MNRIKRTKAYVSRYHLYLLFHRWNNLIQYALKVNMLTEQLSQLKSVSKDIVMCYPILINKKSCVKNPVRHLTSMLILYRYNGRTRWYLILASTLKGHFQTFFQCLFSAYKTLCICSVSFTFLITVCNLCFFKLIHSLQT